MKKILALMGAVLLLSVSARAVEVSAPSAVLMEKETGTVLFAKNEHEKLEPASVTKIMTLLLTMEAIDGGTLRYEDTVTASPHACCIIRISEHIQQSGWTLSGMGRPRWSIPTSWCDFMMVPLD